MNMMTTIRPATGELPLARTTQRVRSRLHAAAAAIAAIVDCGASKLNPMLAGSIVMPFANIALTGTNCARPLWFAECETIAKSTGLDVVLLRFDALRGATFDILDHNSMFWRCGHVAWRRRDGDLWLIPEVGFDAFIRVSAWGLEHELEPPFVSNSERSAGIIRAIEHPSFEGRI
jgi:hypothetical protein